MKLTDLDSFIESFRNSDYDGYFSPYGLDALYSYLINQGRTNYNIEKLCDQYVEYDDFQHFQESNPQYETIHCLTNDREVIWMDEVPSYNKMKSSFIVKVEDTVWES